MRRLNLPHRIEMPTSLYRKRAFQGRTSTGKTGETTEGDSTGRTPGNSDYWRSAYQGTS